VVGVVVTQAQCLIEFNNTIREPIIPSKAFKRLSTSNDAKQSRSFKSLQNLSQTCARPLHPRDLSLFPSPFQQLFPSDLASVT
jgi:hypothetical protein